MVRSAIDRDLKEAMLARDASKVEVLRGLKSAFLYAEVELKLRETGLSEEQVLAVIKKEAKKRQDSIAMFEQGGNQQLADKEKRELALIRVYLPPELSSEQVDALIDEAVAEFGLSQISRADMGRLIGAVKAKGGAQVDPSLVASLIQKRVIA